MTNENYIHLYVHQTIVDVLERETDNEYEFLYWKLKGATEPFSGFVQFYDKNDDEVSKLEYRDGKPYNGHSYHFHSNGNPQSVREYEKGKYIGNEEFDENGRPKPKPEPKLDNKTDYEIEFVDGNIHEAFYKVNGREIVVYYIGREFDNEYSVYDYPDGLAGVEIDAYAEFYDEPKINGLKFTIYPILEVDDDGDGWMEWFRNFSALEEATIILEN